MTKEDLPTFQHRAAARHHAQAAARHIEASRHYQIGKDYAHAAHQAMAARGHGLWAQTHADKADRARAPQAPAHAPPLDVAGPLATVTTAVDHHLEAALHHKQAARHHFAALKHFEEGAHRLAAEESHAARDHSRRSLFHGDAAAVLHIVLADAADADEAAAAGSDLA